MFDNIIAYEAVKIREIGQSTLKLDKADVSYRELQVLDLDGIALTSKG